MRLEPLYRLRFTYPNEWEVRLGQGESTEGQYFFLAEGQCEGRIAGRFRGANHPQRRGDGTFLPNFQGVIETEDGATILFDFRGYGRAYPVGRRQIVSTTTHLSDHERYRWLNDAVCVGEGEVRAASEEGGVTELVVDVAELMWEPIED